MTQTGTVDLKRGDLNLTTAATDTSTLVKTKKCNRMQLKKQPMWSATSAYKVWGFKVGPLHFTRGIKGSLA